MDLHKILEEVCLGQSLMD